MPVRSRPIFAGQFTTTAGVDTIYTVPADRTLIVKDVRAYRASGSATHLFLFGDQGDGTAPLDVLAFNAQAWAVSNPPPWAVLEEGGVLQTFLGAALNLRLWISGSLLDGDPA